MPGKSVFISHSSKDDPLVRALRQSLEALGVEVWADSERLLGGDLLSPVLEAEVRKANYFLAVASLAALNSEWVQREIGFAKKAGKKIVPLMRPEIGPRALRLLFGEEPVGIRIESVMHALPDILAALEMRLPTEVVRQAQEQAAPVADLVLELKDPAIADVEGKQRATAVATLCYIPADGSPRVESVRYKFTAPIGPIEAEELSWYLERYIQWPSGYFEERARRVIEALPQWGRLLYDGVNVPAAHDALHAWKLVQNAERRFTVKVDKSLIEGAPQEEQNKASEAATLLLALPWELIHDAHSYLFQGKRPVRVRRSLPNRGHQAALATKPPIRVLLVSPRPDDVGYIDHRISAKPLVEALSELGDLAEFRLLDPPTFPALEKEILRAGQAEEPYHVVHFDGHGVYDRKHGLGMLCFEDPADAGKLEHRRSKLVSADEIARIVREHRIPLVFLEACQSAQSATDPGASVAGRLLESGVASVAAMSHSVLVESARIFIADFYRELLHGKRVGQAMLAGQRALMATTKRGRSFNGEVHLHDWFVPVLFQEEQDPVLIREVPAEQVKTVIAARQKLALGDLPEEPTHEFLGRSRDLLKAERLLARERYLVVLGSGGEGKTTFAAELARWLVETRRFARAVFTSVEQITEPRQVLFSVGGQLVTNFESHAGADDARGLQLVERALGEHATVLVIDNVESILDDKDAIGGILALCGKLGKIGGTRLIFTSRGPLPKPFDAAANTVRIGRLDRDSAIELLGKLLPHAPKSDESEEDLRNLVDAVGCHARSLVLIAKEVGAAGVRHATRDLLPILKAIEAKNPGNRENSLLASAELSLRRLPDEIRQLIRPLGVFQGGGGIPAIALALELDQDGLNTVAGALMEVGLAEYVEPQYLRFDPALLATDLTAEEREVATAAWAEAMAAEIGFLYGQKAKDASLANNLTLLELPNFLAALNRLAVTEPPERLTDLATSLEALVADINRPRVLARIVEIRTAAARRLSEWSHAAFVAERASVERLINQGRPAEAVQAARVLNMKAEAVGDSPYEGAAYDLALARFTLGRALRRSGDANAALPILDDAHERFERLGKARMAATALKDKADCLSDLGRYDEAAAVYEQVIRIAEGSEDPRSAAACKGQLATVRMEQGNHKEALRLHSEARETFESLNEPAMVAVALHQIGRVHQEAGNFEGAERAYQASLRIKTQTVNRSGQASTLNQLGNLYSAVGKREDAVRFYLQAVEIHVEAADLRSEGRSRNNLAHEFIKLRRYDEARREIERAIACDKPFGHVALPWTTFNILYNLEIATGHQPAALAARRQALDAYLAYRRQGGHPQMDPTQIVELVRQDPAAARTALDDPEISYRLAAEIIFALDHPDPEPLE